MWVPLKTTEAAAIEWLVDLGWPKNDRGSGLRDSPGGTLSTELSTGCGWWCCHMQLIHRVIPRAVHRVAHGCGQPCGFSRSPHLEVTGPPQRGCSGYHQGGTPPPPVRPATGRPCGGWGGSFGLYGKVHMAHVPVTGIMYCLTCQPATRGEP